MGNFCSFSSKLHVDKSHFFGKNFDKIIKTALNSNLFATTLFPGDFFISLGLFRQIMRNMLFGMMRGSQNASELVPLLPFWLNSEKRCVEVNAKVYIFPNNTKACKPDCSPVKWENTLHEAFVNDCE